MRLGHALDAARELLRREPANGDADVLEGEREAAIEAVRTLDAFHMMRVVDLQHEFEQRMKPLERDSVDRHRREIGAILAECGALVRRRRPRRRAAASHALVRRARADARTADLRVVGRRDGADRAHRPVPRQPAAGPGNAEVFEQGLGVFPNLLPLPHARKRLHLTIAQSVALFARRFAPAQVIAFDR